MRSTGLLAFALVTSVAACGGMGGDMMFGGINMSMFDTKVGGQIAVRSANGAGGATLAFDDCMSGEPEGFFGVELVSSGAPAVLRVTQDPIEGTRARLTTSAGSATFAQASCTALQAEVGKTGTKINGVTLLEGKVLVDCRGDDGASYAGTVTFAQCHTSQRAAQVIAGLGAGNAGTSAEMASAVPVPDTSEVPQLPAPLRALTVRAKPRVVGATINGDTVETATKACLENEREFLQQIGWTVVDGDAADLEVEMGCTGHVALLETPSALAILLPPADGASITLRSGGQVIDAIAAGPRALRCDLPQSADRTKVCAARAEAWGSARLEGLLAQSQPLAAFAASRHK